MKKVMPYKVCVVDDRVRKAFFVLAPSPLDAAKKSIPYTSQAPTVITVFAVDDFDVMRRANSGSCDRFVLVRMPVEQFVKKTAHVRFNNELADCIKSVHRDLAQSISDGTYSKRNETELLQALKDVKDEECPPCYELQPMQGQSSVIDFKELAYEPFSVSYVKSNPPASLRAEYSRLIKSYVKPDVRAAQQLESEFKKK